MNFFLEKVGETEKTEIGKTMIIDRMGTDPSTLLNLNNKFVSTVKIGWGLSLLCDEKFLGRRISDYKQSGFGVSNGGTLLEIAFSKGRLKEALQKIRQAGFDTIEMSEGVIDLPHGTKSEIRDFARSGDMHLVVEVGRKNTKNQLSLDETVERIQAAKDLDPDVIIIEGRETGRGVEIYDMNGNIKWDWVEEILRNIDLPEVMFEAPDEVQQAELVIRLGAKINLGNISMSSAFALASQRLGLRGDTFGISTGSDETTGGPASKFILFLLQQNGPMDQGRIAGITGLSRRTVQNAIGNLIADGRIHERPDLHDMRRKVYSIK